MKKTVRKETVKGVRPAPPSRGNGESPNSPAIEGRLRVAIEHVEPQVDGGYPIKRVVGDSEVRGL